MPAIKSVLFRALLVFASFCVISLAAAKTVYINDQLRVGIRPEPNNDSAPLTVVTTGDKLELLDTNAGYVMVRTEEGVEGWIKEIYTTTDMPAIVKLKELSETTGGSDKKIRELKEQVGIMQSANKALTDELEQAREEKNKIQIQLMGLKNGQPSGGWMYWLLGMLVFAAISFIFGMFWYRNQAMKRLGGLRIYF